MATEQEVALEAAGALFGRPTSDGVREGAGRSSALVKYWVKPDGWIETGPSIRDDAPAYQRYISVKHYKELPDRFGIEIAGSAGGTMRGRDGKTKLRKFIENGGLTYICTRDDTFGKEGQYLFTKEQLVTYGMHREPFIRSQRPDLADVVDVECKYGCLVEGTNKRRVFAYEAWRDQHVVAAHHEAIASEAVGKTIADAMAAQSKASGMDANTIAAIVAAVMQQMSGTQTAAVAATTVAKEKKPSTAKYQPSEAPLPPGEPNKTWKRFQLVSYIKRNDIPRGFAVTGGKPWMNLTLTEMLALATGTYGAEEAA